MKRFTLSEATVCPQLNAKEGQAADFARNELPLTSLKYKHFREMMQFPEQEQLHQLMLRLTGLSDDDIGELTPEDAAGISKVVIESMKGYMQLGQSVMAELNT